MAVRPFMYLFYFPWANLGFGAFRCANIVVGSLIPCLIFLLSKRFRVNSYLAVAVALLASLNPEFVFYSVIGFPDTLATALVLAGYLAYFSGRLRLATLLLCLTVLTKEAFAMFLIPLLVLSGVEFLRYRRWSILAPMAGILAVVIANGTALFFLGGRLQGWSSTPVEPAFFARFLTSYWFIPFIAVLLLRKNFEVLAVSLGAPLFFCVWGYVLHKGIDTWYIIGPLAIALVVASVALQGAIENLSQLVKTTESGLPRWQRVKAGISGTVAAGCLFTITAAPQTSGWPSLRIDQTLEQFEKPGPLANSGQTEQMVSFLNNQRRPKTLLAMDVFWALTYYPLARQADRVDKWYSTDNEDPGEIARLARMLSEPEYVVWGKVNPNARQALHFAEVLKHCLVYANDEYKVYHLDRKCRRSLDNSN